jgi:hypothetical protein
VGVQLVGIEPDLPVADGPDGSDRDSLGLREGDLFPTALPPEPGTWTPPDPAHVAAIAECTGKDGLVSKRLRRERPPARRRPGRPGLRADAAALSPSLDRWTSQATRPRAVSCRRQ